MKKTKLALAIATASFMSSQAFATNGMNMDGYGPVSEAMGGTAQAYNNGLGGMMNNPATMGMGSKAGNKVQIAVGNLRPDVSAEMTHPMAGKMTADSDGTSYLMPGFGFARKSDGLTYGIGVLAQGGMGTEYDEDTFLAATTMGASTGDEVRSELSVGRVVVPINYEVTDRFTVGASIDYIWAGLDLKMAAPSNQLGALVDPNKTTLPVDPSTFNTARFDFSDDSDFTGEAKGTGFGGKIGITYQINDKVSFGASYHSKTKISDLESSNASISLYSGAGSELAEFEGDIKVKDFQWPSTIAMGFSFKPTDKLMINTDFKRINWSETMKEFAMEFTVDNNAAYGPYAGKTLAVALPQEWEDQNVFMVGAQYQLTDSLKVRGGANLSTNPVPGEYLNPLFPAIVEKHYTAGFGYNINQNNDVDFSLSYSPEVKQMSAQGITSSHSQMSWQLMYTYKWGIVKK